MNRIIVLYYCIEFVTKNWLFSKKIKHVFTTDVNETAQSQRQKRKISIFTEESPVSLFSNSYFKPAEPLILFLLLFHRLVFSFWTDYMVSFHSVIWERSCSCSALSRIYVYWPFSRTHPDIIVIFCNHLFFFSFFLGCFLPREEIRLSVWSFKSIFKLLLQM